MITYLRNFKLDTPQVHPGEEDLQQIIDYIVLELRSELELTHVYRGHLKLWLWKQRPYQTVNLEELRMRSPGAAMC